MKELIMNLILLGMVISLYYFIRNDRLIKADKNRQTVLSFYLMLLGGLGIFFGMDFMITHLRDYFVGGEPFSPMLFISFIYIAIVLLSVKVLLFGIETMPEEESN